MTPSEPLQHIVTLVEASAGLKDDTQRKVLLERFPPDVNLFVHRGIP